MLTFMSDLQTHGVDRDRAAHGSKHFSPSDTVEPALPTPSRTPASQCHNPLQSVTWCLSTSPNCTLQLFPRSGSVLSVFSYAYKQRGSTHTGSV